MRKYELKIIQTNICLNLYLLASLSRPNEEIYEYSCRSFFKKGDKVTLFLPSPLSTALMLCVINPEWINTEGRRMRELTIFHAPLPLTLCKKHGTWRMLGWQSVNLKWSFHRGEMAHLCPMMIRTLTSKNSHFLRRELSSQGSPRMLQG